MLNYKAPLKDISFQLHDVFHTAEHMKGLEGFEEHAPEDLDAILDEGAKFVEKVVAPLMRSGDEEGVHFEKGEVKLPKGWADSYRLFAENGWSLLEISEQWGGSRNPAALGSLFQEMLAAANPAWGMPAGLTVAAIKVLESYAAESLKNLFIPKLAEGTWHGTMCLTEPQAGTDLSLVKTKASPLGDGLYEISGSKMFITAGDHDGADNIIHLVLARLPDAPEGTKGISLFLVPKLWVNEDGTLGGANQVVCGSVEHKMGIKASPTCVMNFDGAKGYLVGQEHRGLNAMFTMMNLARIGTGIQGYAAGCRSYQVALDYAKDRLQMRSLSGKKNPDGPADPIIVHPDVRRMLLTQKALVEGCRALTVYVSQLVDKHHYGKTGEVQAEAGDLLGLLTPILKGFSTEVANEITSLGVQILGGHGYICEHGQEQLLRDARISAIYEGTTGVQALDLLGRKVLMNEGKVLRRFTKEIHLFCEAHKDHAALKDLIAPLAKLNREWGDLTMKIGMGAMKNPDEVGAASVDYLMYAGYVCLAYLWARQALTAHNGLGEDKNGTDAAFLNGKIKTAAFYFQRLLPRTEALKVTMLSGAANLMHVDLNSF